MTKLSDLLDKDVLEQITSSMKEIYSYENPANRLFIAKLNIKKFQELLTTWGNPEKEIIEDHIRWLEYEVRESYPEIPDEFIPIIISPDGYDDPEECEKFFKQIKAAKDLIGLGKISG